MNFRNYVVETFRKKDNPIFSKINEVQKKKLLGCRKKHAKSNPKPILFLRIMHEKKMKFANW